MSSNEDQIEKFFNSDSLNEEFFIEIVENKLGISQECFKIKLFLISAATGKNENYASLVYRAKIKIQLNETNSLKVVDVIIKASLVNMPELKEFGVFPRETFMYKEILSSFEKIWFEKSGEKIQFSPQGLKFTTDPYEMIVLDDLKPNGYVMLDRKVGLTVEQGKMVLSKLAKFHAISALRYQKEGVLGSCLARENAAMDVEIDFVKGFIRMFEELIKALERFGDCEIYVEKLKKFNHKSTFNEFINDDSEMKCGLKVLNHGDLWINNIMFKIDTNQNVNDVLLLDYQLGFWGSPMVDFTSFVLTSIHDDLKAKHFDEFVEYYHQELSKALEIIGYEKHIPTLAEIYEEMMEKNDLAAMVPSYIFFMKYSSDEPINLEAMMGESNDQDLDEIYRKIYECPILQKSIKQLMAFLNERGFLECKQVDAN
ncbi:hypothetical protein PVAND_008495 [Polypedilum vanderplanki]|uniref:CHK kinase-like domain-containing protein n=1 Tax=Polypedilum vanderplanki TaxID=319348 RepID=A0A9J6CAF1_POLVA|nr:hypothetical protein PVAND_008495 [Polypedilum vanderplanki]